MITNTNDTEYFTVYSFFVWLNTKITKKLVFYDSEGEHEDNKVAANNILK